jgi:hypothetical protein
MHSTASIQSTLKPFLEGYRIGMTTGGTTFGAMWNVHVYIEVALYSGTPLPSLDSDITGFF